MYEITVKAEKIMRKIANAMKTLLTVVHCTGT
jgi:hypothetical protein